MKKQRLLLFNTPLYAGLGSKKKKKKKKKCLATTSILSEKTACCLKINEFYSRSERTHRLDPPPPVRFSSLFKDPPLHK